MEKWGTSTVRASAPARPPARANDTSDLAELDYLYGVTIRLDVVTRAAVRFHLLDGWRNSVLSTTPCGKIFESTSDIGSVSSLRSARVAFE